MASLQRLRVSLHTRLLLASHRLESMAHYSRAGRPRPQEAQILADLEVDGVHVTSIDRLLPRSSEVIHRAMPGANALLRERLTLEGSGQWSRGRASTDLRAEVLLRRVPEFYLLGLDVDLLALVRRYLRLPIAYHGAAVRHSLVDGEGAGPRLWHRDAEDFHVFRVVVYLNAVSEGGGPFEYVPRNVGAAHRRLEGRGALTDEEMHALVPRKHWKRIYGPEGTVILADTAQVFHHESLQTARERSVIMLGYSSRRPKNLQLAMAHFPVERVQPILSAVVPEQQHAYVFAWRRRLLAEA